MEFKRVFDHALARLVANANHIFENVMAATSDKELVRLANIGLRLESEIMDRTRGRPHALTKT